ncbi:2-keto-4-pentenoate hydratase [Streptomyces bingchenggensis BCW-1]|uniref:2-keto-4-pentenoate hydratase n=1 Tax=Streptomyces bingchenggensis (strain BCW-1) TaxID=749414 RepID=D7BW54_STRBB|nr:2-keto-4-pentenoate hydratase [Streptomyces milbemycinicus]ADI11764.1 2-keto-4-pentenoate hydratase [Streptomyces bingchenggensis BCW-1]
MGLRGEGLSPGRAGALRSRVDAGSTQNLRTVEGAEAEVALLLEQDLDLGRHTGADVVRAAVFALPVLEVVDSRIANWDIDLADTIADNGSSGAFAVGAVPVPLA